MRNWLSLAMVVGTSVASVVACNDTDAISPAIGGQAGQSGHAGQSTSGAGDGGSADGTTPRAGAAGAISDAGSGATTEDSDDDNAGQGGEGGAGSVVPEDVVTSLTVSPLDLFPAFSSSITDYYVRCAAGENALTLTTTSSASGTTTRDVTLAPDEATSVADKYFIRCLPPDFPVVTVTKNGTPTPGYYLSNSANYVMVFDGQGVPVWYARGEDVLNLDSPAPNVLSFMLNFDSDQSNFDIRDLANNTLTLVTASGGAAADGHELQMLPNGNRIVLTSPVVSGVDLTGLQGYGANEDVLSCNIEELDPAGNLLWSWKASDHIDPVQESLEPSTVGTAADVYHCNSIDADANGNLLLSVRYANALYYIDRTTGQVTWKLNGSAYSKDGAALIQIQGDSQTAFNKQHDARFHGTNGNVTLFDDHGIAPGVARGIEYSIDHTTNVATPVFQFLGTAASTREGGFRRYDDGESVVCWGNVPTDLRFLTEVDAAGNDVFDLSYTDTTNVAYRAIKVPLSQFDIALLRANTAK